MGKSVSQEGNWIPWMLHEQGIKRGVDYGTRTHQEPVSLADKHLHAACYLMAHHLRIMEKKRLDLLVRTMVVHSALTKAGHHNNELEESKISHSGPYGPKGATCSAPDWPIWGHTRHLTGECLGKSRGANRKLPQSQTPREIKYNQTQYHNRIGGTTLP